MRNLFITIFLMSGICSCKVTKYIDRVEIKTDSSAVHERDSVLQVKKEDSVYYKNVIESLGENTIIFQDTGTTKIVYAPDGSIQIVEGKLKSVNSKLSKTQTEVSVWKQKYDSLFQVKTKDSVQVKTEFKEVEVKKKVSFIPWWVWLICAGALVVGWKLNKITVRKNRTVENA